MQSCEELRKNERSLRKKSQQEIRDTQYCEKNQMAQLEQESEEVKYKLEGE